MFPILGDIIGGAFDYFGQKATNSANRQLARENRDWQEHMSNTAYRRATRDMKKSGLNPILAYQQGGASSPPGSVIPMENPAENAGQVGRNVADHLLAAKRMKAEIENLNSATALNVEKSNTERSTQQTNAASAAYTNAQTATETVRPDLLRNQNLSVIQDLDNKFFANLIQQENLSVAQAEAAIAKINQSITEGRFGSFLVLLERLGVKPGDLASVLARKIPGFRMPTAPTSGNSPQLIGP